MQVSGANGAMMRRRMMFRKIIAFVYGALAPVNEELTLSNPIPDPIIAHVHRFGAFLLDRIVGDAGSSTVVGLDGGRRLIVTQFFETSA